MPLYLLNVVGSGGMWVSSSGWNGSSATFLCKAP
jgi:hypothetical protein